MLIESTVDTCRGKTDAKELAWRTLSSDDAVNWSDFVQRVFELAAERGVPVHLDVKRGKGSHATLYYGNRKTVVKDRRQEIGRGLLSEMIRQLDLKSGDFR